MADLKISQLTALPETGIDALDQLPLADVSAAVTKRVTPLDLFIAGARLAPTGGIPGIKVDFSSGVTLPAGSVTTTQLADGSVTTLKVADGAITDGKIAGPIGLGKLGNVAAGAVLAGAAAGGSAGAPTFRALLGSDLPLATTAAVGGVKVSGTGGLIVAGDGALSMNTTIAPGSGAVVTFNTFGQVTAARTLTGADLPPATGTTVGGVKAGSGLSVAADGTLSAALGAVNLPLATSTTVGGVKPGVGLSVDGAGALGISNAVTAAEHPVISYDAQGLVTGGRALTAADLPEIDAAKITHGVLPAGRIGDGSITRAQLADYATAYIQEGAPPTTGVHAGALWLQESTGQLRMWNSNSWFPIGFGRLSQENLRYCGTFNAATGAVTGLTPFGVTEGFKIGDQVPSASDKLSGVYLVATVAGNGTPAAAGVNFDNGDWVLCNGATAGWVRVDTLSGAGGGGGATHLNDLLDVTIDPAVAADNLLQYTASGQWINVGAIDGGSY
jgi:hypothetical protein